MNRKLGVRIKLILVIIPAVLLLIACFFMVSRGMIMEQDQKKLEAESQVYARDISGWADRIMGELRVYQDAINKNTFGSDEEILTFLETSVNSSSAYPAGIYMGDDSGVYLDGSGWVPGPDWVLTERDWYVEGCEHEELAFGEPYYDSNTGQVCVSVSVRMDYEQAVRVMAVDVYLDYVSDMMKGIRIEESGRAFLVTGKQMVIAHPDQSMMEVTLDRSGLDALYGGIGQKLREGTTGSTRVKGDNGYYRICIYPIEHTDWQLITFVSEKEVLRDLYQLELYMILIAAAAAAALVILILRMMSRIVKPVHLMTDTLAEVATGDFTRNLETRGNDEIAAMSGNMQIFLEKMRNMISEISRAAKWLSEQSRENGMVSATLAESSGCQQRAMAEMDTMVARLSDIVEGFSKHMELLIADVRTAFKEGTNAGDIMSQAGAVSRDGQQAMNQIRQGMNVIEQSITSLTDQMQQTWGAIDRINEMVRLIMEISEETNLLSLNASIEAARAGDAGRGFAVVAEQIGRLAANSTTAADDISGVTQHIRDMVSKAVDYTEISAGKVRENAAMIEAASQTFGGIFDQVEEAERIVTHMVDLVGQVDQMATQMEDLMECQLQVSQDISQSAKTLGEHTQVVAGQSEKASESARALEQQSSKLMTDVGQFRI